MFFGGGLVYFFATELNSQYRIIDFHRVLNMDGFGWFIRTGTMFMTYFGPESRVIAVRR